MAITASELRQNIYRLLDEVLQTGVPLEVELKGRRLKVVPADPASRVAALDSHPGTITGDPEDLVHLDWTVEWRPSL